MYGKTGDLSVCLSRPISRLCVCVCVSNCITCNMIDINQVKWNMSGKFCCCSSFPIFVFAGKILLLFFCNKKKVEICLYNFSALVCTKPYTWLYAYVLCVCVHINWLTSPMYKQIEHPLFTLNLMLKTVKFYYYECSVFVLYLIVHIDSQLI